MPKGAGLASGSKSVINPGKIRDCAKYERVLRLRKTKLQCPNRRVATWIKHKYCVKTEISKNGIENCGKRNNIDSP
jgi:hypothetical protein